MIDQSAVVILIVDSQVVGELIAASTKREVVLLHHSLLIYGICILLGIVVLLERSQLVLQFFLGNFSLSSLVIGIFDRSYCLGTHRD